MDYGCPNGVESSTVTPENGLEVVCASADRWLPGPVGVVGALFALLFVAFVVAAIVTGRKRRQALAEAGLNPHLTGEEQIAAAHRARSASAPVPQPPARSVEERLAELDDLLRREKITADEHARARLAILTDD